LHKRIVPRARITPADGWPDDIHPVLRRIYQARNLRSPEELGRGLDRLHPVSALARTDQAAELLHRMLADGRRMLIVADFDADGATGCALAVRGLRRLGAEDVRFLVPNRFDYGYGLTPEIVELAARQRPDLIITVDNGIASNAGVAEANRRGIPVLITDHHLPGASLPQAAVVVNPNQPGDHFPSKHLAGVGTIFYVLLALRARLRQQGWFAARGIPEPNMAELLDLVALGTVADVVPLDQNNRILVAQGLARVRAGRCCAGIQALLQVAGRSPERVVAADFGFAVGPRLNAAGRLDDMTLGIDCLLSDDPGAALEMARELDQLNRDRRLIEAQMQNEALAVLERLVSAPEDELPFGLCLHQSDWHQGVVGLVASRVKERYHRPVIAFAQAGDGWLKGSARSVPGLHIRDTLDALATRHPQLLSRFGGHAMAAGLSIQSGHLEAFSAAFDDEVRRNLSAQDLQGEILSDGPLEPADLNLELAEILRNGGPWGQGFPEPLFDGEFEVLDQRIVGERHLKMQLGAGGGRQRIDAIAFNQAQPLLARRVRLAYRLDVNEYQGQRTPQLVVEYIAGEVA
jgi:single-stranded-DNA-specific exonuclease